MSATRTPISHSQRVALRHHFRTTNPKPTQSALRAWFETQFGHEISQSVVSRTLSDSFAHLDVGAHSASGYRSRNCQWPWLETLLTDWLQEAEGWGSEVSNDVIGRKAKQLWEQSEESQGLAVPTFSAGWVVKFRRRHGVRLQSLPDRQRVRMIAKHFSDRNSSPLSNGKSTNTHKQASVKLSTLADPCTTSSCLSSEFHITTTFSFSSDLLLHLIQHNTFRALMSNKSLVLRAAVTLEAPDSTVSIKQFPTRMCGGIKVIRPLINQGMPESLYPTELQMNCAHTSWITMFPFPKFRDNLIKRGVDFVPEEMCSDLFADIFPDYFRSIPSTDERTLYFRDSSSTQRSCTANSNDCTEVVEDQDDYTAGRRCLIIWGDPWKVDSWEVTPTFLKRWRWALEGCDDLIYASNRWRALRNEEPIRWPSVE